MMTHNTQHLPVPVDLWCISVYLFWPDEPLGIYSGSKSPVWGQSRARLTKTKCSSWPDILVSILLGTDSFGSELAPNKSEKKKKEQSSVATWFNLMHESKSLMQNVHLMLRLQRPTRHAGGHAWQGSEDVWLRGDVGLLLCSPPRDSAGLQEHLSPQGVSRAKMNEPPVDSLPPWQMAQERGGHRGLGGGVCGYVCVCVCVCVCLHVSERESERERERERECFCCAEGKSGIPISFYHDKGDLRHTREEWNSICCLGISKFLPRGFII